MFASKELKYKELPLPDRMDFSDEKSLAAINTFYAHMKKRHSVRDFSDRKVERSIIETAIKTAGSAPSGANHQPWHFVAVSNPEIKHKIRLAAEAEEKKFYEKSGGDEWIKALEPLGTSAEKPHLDIAPWLIVIFAQRTGFLDDGTKFKNYYVNESVGIATGFLISALHMAGLSCLTHTPNPMKFLTRICKRPASEKPVMILVVGHASENATVPAVAKIKKPLDEILTMVE
ncbi:Nitroreductase family protein [hydrothermal vent metagenome]|uniref:Nitroreductase family protein n=1 Tax=hydrothermal vent metagenome TaxID=652676 RepID=A0A3B0TVK1_9ZZZZ